MKISKFRGAMVRGCQSSLGGSQKSGGGGYFLYVALILSLLKQIIKSYIQYLISMQVSETYTCQLNLRKVNFLKSHRD